MLIGCLVVFILSLLMIWGAKKLEVLARAIDDYAQHKMSQQEYQEDLLKAVKQIQANTSPDTPDPVQETLEDIKALKRKQADKDAIEQLLNSLDDSDSCPE